MINVGFKILIVKVWKPVWRSDTDIAPVKSIAIFPSKSQMTVMILDAPVDPSFYTLTCYLTPTILAGGPAEVKNSGHYFTFI